MSFGFVGRRSLGTEERGNKEPKAQEKESKYKWDQKQADYNFPRSSAGSLILNSVFQTSTALESCLGQESGMFWVPWVFFFFPYEV